MMQPVLCQLRRAARLLLLLALVITACARRAQAPTPAPTLTTPPTEAPTVPPTGDQPDAVIRLATEALATSLGVETSAIALVAMARQEFPDAALGCPQPGELAAAVITPGYTVVLSAGGTEYELHTNLNGTLVRCLPTGTPVAEVPQVTPGATPSPTPDDGIDKTALDTVEAALESKDYARLKAAMSSKFWLGFYASEANQLTPDEAIERLEELYLGPGLVRAYREVEVEKLLPDWTSAAPYARFVYSTGWGESQKDDGILLFEEQGGALQWAGLFYIFDGLKKTAYGSEMAGLPPPPVQSLGALADAIAGKRYETLKSLMTDPIFLGFYASEASELSPDAFVEELRRNYLEPGEARVRFDVDVARLLPPGDEHPLGWSVGPSCDELLYSTGWGQEQADDGILCLKQEPEGLRWTGMLYILSNLKEIAYAEPPPAEEEEPAEVEGMVHIPAGPFTMGSSDSQVGAVAADCRTADAGCNTGQFEDEKPQRQVTLDGFYIDETEVTLAAFKAFVVATGYRSTSEAKGDAIQYTWRAFDAPERQDHPVRWMSWQDANAYCQWAGKRLPTEAEWEKAARGTEGLIYPWGNTWDDARVPHGDTAPVTAVPNGASPYGVLGMAGGVWEWVADWYDPYYYQSGPTVNPTGPEQTRDKVLRGGAFDNVYWKQRAAHRHFGGATGYAQDHGFRCARDE
jgi:formylglycine-generating enzyme required for sulfatase activity